MKSSVVLIRLKLSINRAGEIKDSSAASSPPARTLDDVIVHTKVRLSKLTSKLIHMGVQDIQNVSEARTLM